MKSSNPATGIPLEKISLASTIDLFEVLMRRRWIVVSCVVLSVLAGLAYYLMAKPVYESRASLLLIQRRPETITKDQRYQSSFDDYVATHRALIVSPMIIQRAIDSADLDQLASFKGIEGVALQKTIIYQLTVTSGPRDLGDNADNIMTLAFQGPIPEDGPKVVQAVLNSYRMFLDETYRGMSNDTVRLIGEARDLLKNDLQRNEEAYVNFRQESPLVARGREEVNPLQDRLAAIETRRTDLLLRRAEIDGQLKSLEAAREQGYDARQMTAFVASLRNSLSPGNAGGHSAALDSQLFQLSDREKQLLEHYGPNHPHVVALRDRIAAVRTLQAVPTSEAPEPANEIAEALPSEIVDRYVNYLKQQRSWIDTSEDLLSNLYMKEHELAQELSSYQLKDERHRRAIDLTQKLYEGVIGQLQEASLIKDFGGFDATVIADPEKGEKVGPRGKIVLALAGMLGSALGVVLGVAFEMRDKSFRSRDDIQSRLGLRVLADIPLPDHSALPTWGSIGADSRVARLWATQADAPGSEAIRGLRTSLLFNPSFTPIKILQLTGPSSEDETGLIAANLAVSIAQLGRRVLLIDANLHRPQQHELFGVAGGEGLSTLFTSGQSLDAVIRATDVAGLSLLPAGTSTEHASEFFTLPRFSEILRELRTQYDFVVIDSPPLLERSDACVIGAQVDGVLLGIRPTSDSRSRADRAVEVLNTTGIRPIGAVVHGVMGDRRLRAMSGHSVARSEPSPGGNVTTSNL